MKRRKTKVHARATIESLCAGWDSFTGSYAEILKNSNDEYERLFEIKNIADEERQIILFFRDSSNRFKQAIGVLDFGGITRETIEERLTEFNKPKQARGEMDLASHGNGGKIFAVKFFKKAFWHTVINNKANIYGYEEDKKIKDHDLPYKKVEIDYKIDEKISSIEKELEESLFTYFGIKFKDLPINIQEIIKDRKGFTFFVGLESGEYKKNIKTQNIIEDLSNNQQSGVAVERSTVTYFKNKSYIQSRLNVPLLPKLKGFENFPKIFEIPKTLIDPQTDKEINTGANEKSHLIIAATEIDLVRSAKFKTRHIIAGLTTNKIPTGYFIMKELMPHTTYANKLYGTLYLDKLNSTGVKLNQRTKYNDCALIRSLEFFLREKLNEVVSELEEKDRQSQTRESLNDMKNFVKEMLQHMSTNFLNMSGIGPGSGKGKGDPNKEKKDAVRIELKFTHKLAGKGVPFEPVLKFFDINGEEAKHQEVNWLIDNYKSIDEYTRKDMLRTILPGFAKVRVTTKKSRLNSNTAEIEVVDITSLEVPKEIRVKKGERTNLQFTAKTFDGRFVEDIYALWETSNQKIARITRSGQIYGASEGTAIIRGGDDDTYSDPITVIVEKNENEHDDPGEKSGGIDIRITNHDSQPESNKPYRPDGATKYPYIFQDEEFRDSGIWWINTDSPLALKIFKENPKQDRRRGSVVHPREARLYIAQCILEIVSRVEIKNEVDDLGLGDISTDEYHRRKNDFSVRFLEYLSENFEKFLK